MSTSLNVVNMAKVFWESFKRFAIRFLSLGIGTYNYKGYDLTQPTKIYSSISQCTNYMKQSDRYALTRLSLSFGGSWGSEEDFSGAVVCFVSCVLMGSTFGGFSSTLIFSEGGGGGVSFWGVSSDGATWDSVGAADFDMTATFVPGVTVSPSLAMNCKIMTGVRNILHHQTVN